MIKGRTIRKALGGGGFLACQIFFFGPFTVQEFFLATALALCMNFFLRRYFPYAQFAIELIKNNATLFY